MVNLTPRPRRPLPERPVLVQSGNLVLEGLYIQQGGGFLENTPCVISCPHPQHGGSMDSPVINEVAYALARAQVPSLRYNYRGVGASQGAFDQGVGEQDDLKGAIAFLVESFYPEKNGSVVACGYSFGSWISFQVALSDSRIERLLLIAPPIPKFDFSQLPKLKCEVAILVGDKDAFCKISEMNDYLEELRKKNPDWQKPLIEIIPHASHYFVQGLSQAGQFSAAYLKTGAFNHLPDSERVEIMEEE